MGSSSRSKQIRPASTNLNLYFLARDMIITFFVGGLASFFQFIFTLLAANKMPKVSYGIFSAVLAIIYLIQIPALALQTFFAKEVAENKNYRESRVVKKTFREFTIYALVASLLIVVLSPFIADTVAIPAKYLLLVAVIVFASILTPVAKGFLLGVQKIALFNVATIIEAFLKLAILLIAFNFTTDPMWPILAYGLPTLAVGLFMIWVIKRDAITSKVKIQIPDVNWNYLIITLVTIFLYNSVFSLDVVYLHPDVRASYSVLAIFGKIVFFASVLVSSVLFSYLVNSDDRKEKNRFLFLGVILNVAVSLSLVYVYIFFGDFLVEAMFQGRYQEIIGFILPVGLGVAFYSIAYVFLQYILSEGEWKQIVVLGSVFFIQLILFADGNDSLYYAVRNQVLTYAFIAIFIILFWYYNERQHLSDSKLS